ncbi:anthranilate phosphoribosyltransferase [Rubrobacter indicoceani]|uniref:anthranilate phosphoribosyltransferase n=1 Tax=Rubrobacter indicoceani TaxID=2051957 RepID=UPI000E5B8E19|nr:anthranilate phosphoribosyltransferase [Rubrobacter indicoceani]
MLREALQKVAGGAALSEVEAERALAEIMSGTVPPEATAALLTALRVRGESPGEIIGFARAMREFAARVEAPEDATDIVGTGGDAKGTINVSTTAAFVARGAGVTIAKHGNRAATSRSGSADVLEALGANIELAPDQVSECIREAGIGFMFARTHHPAMRYVAPVRAGLPFRTIFNLLGPLTNPAGARRLVVGVFSESFILPMAEALRGLGVDRALVVFGTDGLDEITVTDRSLVAQVDKDGITEYEVSPEDFGLSRYRLGELIGGDAKENAGVVRSVLSGGEAGAKRDIVLMNAGAAVFAGGKAADLRDGVLKAREAVDSGAATDALEAFIATTGKLAAS